MQPLYLLGEQDCGDLGVERGEFFLGLLNECLARAEQLRRSY
jgi:hypothetical protein